jgi:hypothetical protein
MEDTLTLAEAMEELVSAEDFLDYFEVPYEASVVHVNRLHILQRFHDYLARQVPNMPPEEDKQRGIYRLWLERAYQDFVVQLPHREGLRGVPDRLQARRRHGILRIHRQGLRPVTSPCQRQETPP